MRHTASMRRSAPFAIGLLMVAGVALWQIESADARSQYLSTFRATYGPTVPGLVGSAIDGCALCHVTPGGPRNPYGQAFEAVGTFDAAAFAAIENMDSDGDGVSNIDEIRALTFPGDPASTPTTTTTTTTTQPTTTTSTTTSTTTTTTQPTTTTTSTTTTTTAPTTTTTSTTTTAPTTTTTTAPTTTTTTAPTTTTTTVPTTTTTTTVPKAPDTFTFDAAGAGKVRLRVDGRELELVSVMPNDGWRYTVKAAGCKHGPGHWDDDDDDDDDDDGCLIKVRFRSGDSRVDFKAWLKRGGIVTDVKVKTVRGKAHAHGQDWQDDDRDDDHDDDDDDDDDEDDD